ncbi:c-type cytochrome [Geobacter argillaceus]|uniref:Mono/diheme cytochrome c family protein n=1 Tax=Geobacter argillaceus TaxID=345631 RepID=A0A562V0H3_9BACT|nr:cytochrome c [Geobacter argillaceus]TWJ11337.1 mono/diheme cytochrome c family protein [Geobacter argillaceus]TWJ11409.1 mono/diheme cytochrome c family protein [Geobacter argillaceus]
MNRKTIKILAAVLVSGMLLSAVAQAQEPPKMPYVFAMYCVMCHKLGVQIGPIGIYDMMSKSGNPLHEQYIRNNTRFGFNAMPAFRVSEVTPKELNAIVAYLKDVAAYRKTHPDFNPAKATQGGVKP